MDHCPAALIARTRGLGIEIVEEAWRVKLSQEAPPDLMRVIEQHHDAIREELWRQQSKSRQAITLPRLKADRDQWIEESKRLGKYRGP